MAPLLTHRQSSLQTAADPDTAFRKIGHTADAAVDHVADIELRREILTGREEVMQDEQGGRAGSSQGSTWSRC